MNPYQPPEPTPEPEQPKADRAIDVAFSPDAGKSLAELGCVVFVVGLVLVLLMATVDWVASRFFG
tara:strand:+ start:4792 stop:4986 length:195 start_codon:yes stop_codon:yes gene_type:complete